MLLKSVFVSVILQSLEAGSIPGLLLNQNPGLPSFCHGLDCPMFTTLQSNNDYEIRHYGPSMWVATSLTTMHYTDDDNRRMFYKLFNYISGNNSAHAKIAMTAPVLRKIEHGQGPDCESNFTQHFMIPFKYQNNPPQPSDPTVFIKTLPAMTVYVKSFGGFSKDHVNMDKIMALAENIGDQSKFYSNLFFTAGYDGPYTFSHRHNEVWVMAK